MYRVLYSSWQCKHQMCTVLGEPSYSFGRTHQFGRTWHTSLHSYTWSPVTNGCVWTLTYVQLFVTPWTVAHQPPLLMGFSRQDFPSHSMGFSMLCGLSFPPSGDLPNLLGLLHWEVDSLPLSHLPHGTDGHSSGEADESLRTNYHFTSDYWYGDIRLCQGQIYEAGWKKKKQRERKGTNGQKGVQVGGFDVWAPSA